MAASFRRSTARSKLYRNARGRVIFALAVFLQSVLPANLAAQVGRAPKTTKGPRALGLVELAPDGKAHLIPITIMIDGKYYDASAYKAAPVPMALWSETVYEGVLTGVSQGLFTVTGALQRKDANDVTEWMAEGTWQSASSLKAKAKKKPGASVPRGINEDEGPPVLRRGSSEKAAQAPTVPATPPQPQSAPVGPAGATPPAAPSPSSNTSPVTPPQDDQAQEDQPPEDKDRPVLKRGKAAPMPAEQLGKMATAPPAKAAGATLPTPATSTATSSAPPSGGPAVSQIQLIPAISDANGHELIPYAYSMKPEEEEQFRKKMLAMAADEIRIRAGQPASANPGTSPPAHASSQRTRAKAVTAVQPTFEDVQLRVFDLANVNEPELVLTAKARMPQPSHEKQSTSPDVQYMITLVAREDVNGDFHKALANVTDTQHLDAIPSLELIDAVDANGDGRGELLFREVSGAGTAFVVYRVIGDQLYPLFQGTPGS
jgi:hypothetical protein